MDNIKSIVTYYTSRDLNQEEIKNILVKLTSLEGITSINVEPDSVHLEFFQHLQSPISLKDALVKAGFPFKSQKKKPGRLKRLIATLGDENKKSYGNKRLGCCDLENK